MSQVKDNFTESIQTMIAAAEALPDSLECAAQVMTMALLSGHKIVCCGNGSSAADAAILATLLINRFETERPSLPAMALTCDNTTLTAIANDYSFEEIYSKQVRALGQAGDILVAISTSGNSRNVIKAMEAAVSRDMNIIALTGMDGGEMAGLVGPNDVEIRVPSPRVPRIQEVHRLTIHCLCDLIDHSLFKRTE